MADAAVLSKDGVKPVVAGEHKGREGRFAFDIREGYGYPLYPGVYKYGMFYIPSFDR